MQYALLEVDLELFLGQEIDDAQGDKVDKWLRIVVDSVFKRPAALWNN